MPEIAALVTLARNDGSIILVIARNFSSDTIPHGSLVIARELVPEAIPFMRRRNSHYTVSMPEIAALVTLARNDGSIMLVIARNFSSEAIPLGSLVIARKLVSEAIPNMRKQHPLRMLHARDCHARYTRSQ